MAKKPKSAAIHPGPGFRIRRSFQRPDGELVRQFLQFETPDISDLLNRLYAMPSNITNLIDDTRVAGPACTVKLFPGDNLMVHKVLDIAQPGDVVVVDAGGARSNAVIGDLIATKAKHRGIAGFVIDGLVRDLPGMQEIGLPVFARGVSPVGPLHRGPGEINYPISCGSVVVNPGDIVVADPCGVVVVRQEFAEELLRRCYAQREALAHYVEDVRRGVFSNEWVDRALEAANCPVLD